MKTKPGSLLLVPSAYFVVNHAGPDGLASLTWGLGPNNDAESERVKDAMGRLLEDFPSLKTAPHHKVARDVGGTSRRQLTSSELDTSRAQRASDTVFGDPFRATASMQI